MLDYKMKILIVDDLSTMRSIVKDILRQLGFYNIEEAVDGVHGFSKLRSGSFDFVIADWNMPNMDGLEMLEKIRKDPLLKDLPVLMLTAETEKEKILSVIRAGVSNYVVKPFTATILKEKIEKIFEKPA